MPSPYYFADRALQVGLIVILDSHHINLAKSKKTNPNFIDVRIETR